MTISRRIWMWFLICHGSTNVYPGPQLLSLILKLVMLEHVIYPHRKDNGFIWDVHSRLQVWGPLHSIAHSSDNPLTQYLINCRWGTDHPVILESWSNWLLSKIENTLVLKLDILLWMKICMCYASLWEKLCKHDKYWYIYTGI